MTDAQRNLLEILDKIAKEQNYVNHQAKVEEISSGGANYTSKLFAVTLSAPGKPDLHLFAKVGVLSEEMRSFSSTPLFEIETIFYTKIVPIFKALEERHNVPEEERLVFAKYYGSSIEYTKDILVLEDLTPQGYLPFDRFKCFDWEYASKCLSSLARLNALSAAYAKDDPEDYVKTTQVLNFDFPVDKMQNILAKNIASAIQHTDEEYRERVKQFFESHLEGRSFLKYFKPQRNMVLRHGDFRPSNILEKTDKGGKSIVMLDFQLLQEGNPITDLMFFLVTNSDEEFRGKHLHQYFEYYYEEFRAALRRLGVDSEEVYKKEHFDEDLKEMLPFGLVLGAVSLPIITVDECKAAKPEEGFDMERLEMEISDLFPVRFNGLVRDYARLGILGR